MSREVKRVSEDFDWVLGSPWKGYFNPYSGAPCPACENGWSDEAKRIRERFYWRQHDVEPLFFKEEEIQGLLNQGIIREEDIPENHMTPLAIYNVDIGVLDGQRVRDYLYKKRLPREGEQFDWDMTMCDWCGGDGVVFIDDEIRQKHEDWEPVEPPEGEAWQLWETVSEGSPITPVFEEREGLKRHMVEELEWSERGAEEVLRDGWAPSGMVKDGRVMSAEEAMDEKARQ